jgi:hypothetical protein
MEDSHVTYYVWIHHELAMREGAFALICHIITFVEYDADTSATAMHINVRMFVTLTDALWGNCQGPLGQR